ncbi:related to ALG13 - catalytic component of UDP-GlcNAc transferase [Melanopsichium pennsylvanicum]|uniref:UDP-N-acetylglucosamine transferase subunit ALG13 n=2 Tax=Melanopsichium pennsylvanicum TaxID=63383 RepID=A0AAJ5C3B3_9BASI|nr:glycosyltransferase family 1 protein [Melanopsichium pennsylvanicum 4]SNX82363.1 related to ALG13 - catalytic component of UDP-GlcNAc transferase [Melanopsichium pennsylvanicum]
MTTNHADPLHHALQHGTLRIFVTVGTTKFDSLIKAVLSHKFTNSIATLASRIQVTVQYGNSSIADIITGSALATPDEGSEIIPEPGMRLINGKRVYQNGNGIAGFDPGLTGSIVGLRLRTSHTHTDAVDSLTPTLDAADPRSASKSLFDSILDEAKATAGLASGSSPASVGQSALQGAKFDLVLQCGVELSMFQFAPDLESYISSADIVISHAGSGTILDTLRMQPNIPTLVVVPNTSLMDNHQVELAEALGREKYLVVGSEDTLGEDVARAKHVVCVKFPDFDPARFVGVVDEVMGL